MPEPHQVVIVGGGFGGLQTARHLRKSAAQITLVDRRNFHLFQPLLYQVATGALSPANIATPLRAIVRRQRNCEVVLGEVTGIDVERHRLQLRGSELSWDTLVLAAGARHSYFGHDEWADHAPGLKTIEDATDIRGRIFRAFEAAEWETDPETRAALLTFVVVGGGPTGVELAGALAEIAHHTLANDFRHIVPSHARIILVEAGQHVLSHYPEDLSLSAAVRIRRLGIEVRTDTMVVDIQPDHVKLQTDSGTEELPTRTVLWGAGVQANSLGRKLASAAGIECDRAGRVPVESDLTIAGHPDIFVIGDMANCPGEDGRPLPGVAPVAMQQGQYVARTVIARLNNRPAPAPFRYRDRGTMATIGRSVAVAWIGGWKFCGYFAWLMWLFVHLMQIVQFQNRLLVLLQWMWNYITFSRSARLITRESNPPPSSPAPPPEK